MPDQAEEEIQIRVLELHEIYSNVGMDLLLQADPNEELVKSYLPGVHTVGAFQNNQLVGMAVVTKEGSEFELKNLSVKPSMQGLGIGKQLINEASEGARSLGAVRLLVGTGNSSLQQLSLYQQCGFRFLSVKKDYFIDYQPPIVENNIRCLDMLVLGKNLSD